jgi:hypothetical protein
VLFSTHAGADFIQGNFVFFVVFAFCCFSLYIYRIYRECTGQFSCILINFTSFEVNDHINFQ